MTDKVYVPGIGSIGAQLMIIGEAPSYAETAAGKPFVGPSGRELDRLLRESGINRGDTWITNVFKYEIPQQQKGKYTPSWKRAESIGINVEQSLQELQLEINAIKPNCILALGKTALWALSGRTEIGHYRGSIMLGMGHKFVATYHPAHLLHQAKGGEFKGYWNRIIMVLDFKRALHQSSFPDLRLPHRTLSVASNSYHLSQFLNKYKNYIHPSIDIESLNCIPTCIGISFVPQEGMTIPLWNTNGISSIPNSDLVQCWLLLAQFLAESDVIGQNFNYDRDKLKRLGFVVRSIHSDTMMKAFTINPELPKNLGFNTSIYTEEPFYKDEGMYGEYDKKKDKWNVDLNELFIGCARDSCVTKEIDDKMEIELNEIGQKEFFYEFVMKLPDFYWNIERTGFGVDNEQREFLLRKYVRKDEEIRCELFKLTGEYVNCMSPKQVKTLLFDTLKCPIRENTGEEELTALLNLQSFRDESKRRVVELILEDRQVRKTIGTYILALPDFDGRMRTTHFAALETGRSSTSMQDPPIRPTVEVVDENGKKKKKSLGMAFQTLTKHGEIGADIRSMLVP